MKLILIHHLAFNDDFSFLFDHKPTLDMLRWEKDDEKILESVFRQANHVDGNEWIAGKAIRSLSVGDSVTLMDSCVHLTQQVRTYVVRGIGWDRVANVSRQIR